MRAWWRRLRARDRRILVIGGFALVLIVYGFGLRIPAHRAVEELESEVNRKQELVAWMEQALGEIRALDTYSRKSARGDTRQALFSLADQSAREAGFAPFLQRVEPFGDGGARLRFENIAFDDLLSWLVRLRKEHAVVALRLTARRSHEEGRVEVAVVLERAGD